MPVTQAESSSQSNRDWIPASRFDAMMVPESLRVWLCNDDLLTRKLQQACGDNFQFQLRGQYQSDIDDAQAIYLSAATGPALLREIALMCAGSCCVYARTLIPENTLSRHVWLADLDAKPLGETLRTRDNCTRSGFDFIRLVAGDALYTSATEQSDEAPAELWARRSHFRLGEDPLLVYEVFMPTIAQCH